MRRLIALAVTFPCLCLAAVLTGGGFEAERPIAQARPDGGRPVSAVPLPELASTPLPPPRARLRDQPAARRMLTIEAPGSATVAGGVTVTLTLVTPSGPAPTGRWAVREGGQVLAEGRFGHHGIVGPRASAAVELPRLGPGAHRFTASYSGDKGNEVTLAAPVSTGIVLIGEETVESFAELAVTGTVGAAVTPCAPGGGMADHTVMLGEFETGHAWSTAKVPTAIAALKHSDTPANRELTRRSIRESDNAAFGKQRVSLGTWAGASAAISAEVLAPNGLTSEIVSTSVPPDGLGMWVWSLRDQAVLAAGMATGDDPETEYVLAQMRHVIAEQSWGLGIIPGTAFKGGWGTEADGELSRQFGIIREPGGDCWAVAIASKNPGGHEAANRDLTTMAEWFSAHRSEFVAGTAGPLPD